MAAEQSDLEPLLDDLERLAGEAALLTRLTEVRDQLQASSRGHVAGPDVVTALEELLSVVIELSDLAEAVRPKIEAQLRRMPSAWG